MDNQNNLIKLYETQIEKQREYIYLMQQDVYKKEERLKEECFKISQGKLYKIVHFIYRSKTQGLNRNKFERKGFRKWVIEKIKGNGGDTDRRFNPIFRIIDVLDEM